MYTHADFATPTSCLFQLGQLTKLEEAEAKVRLGRARCTAAEQPRYLRAVSVRLTVPWTGGAGPVSNLLVFDL